MKLLTCTIGIIGITVALLAHAQQHKGDNFELSNKGSRYVYFSLSDPADIFKKIPKTDKQAIPSFITTTPTSYRQAPPVPPKIELKTAFLAPLDTTTYNDKLMSLAPDESLATHVDTTKPLHLIIARGASPARLNELRLYRLAPHKTVYLKVDEQRGLVPQEGTLKPTLKGLKRFSRSGNSLEYNISPEEIQLVKTVIN